MSTLMDFQVISRTYTKELERFKAQPQQAREIAYFKEKAGSIKSAEEFVKDPRLMKFVLTAYGMAEQNFPGLIKKLLEGGVSDPSSLANRFTDSRYKELVKDLGLEKGQTGNLKFESVRNKIVERFQTVAFETKKGEENGAIRSILYFQRKAPSITSWYQVLGDRAMTEVLKTAFSIPSQTASIDVDKQAAILEKKFPIKDMKNPAKVEKMLKQYAIMSDMQTGNTTTFVPTLTPISMDGSLSFTPQYFTIDTSMMSAISAYKRY